MNGIELIAAERQRQIEMEGWMPEHDDQHSSGELAAAAACYTDVAFAQVYGSTCLVAMTTRLPVTWPWASEWWKPSDDPKRNLEKAGALIAAEIDRLAKVKSDVTIIHERVYHPRTALASAKG